MTLVLSWLRLDLRRRWRSLVVLTLLIAVAGGTVFTALAGARRGASAQQRLLDRTLPATTIVLANTPGFDWTPIRDLPEVETLSLFVVDYNMTLVGFSGDGLSFPPADDEFMRTVEKPVIFAGRAPDPRRADEVGVSRQFVAQHDKGVGDTLTLILATPQEILRQTGSGPHGEYTGPRVTLHIVGVGETSPGWGVDEPGAMGGIVLSPGLFAMYPENIVGPRGSKSVNYINALVRLRHGEADIPQLNRDIKRVTGRSDIDVWNQPAQARAKQRHIAFESRCLLAFAVAAFVAALFLIGQAVARYTAANTEELRTLRAVGMTPRQTLATAVSAPAIAGLLGAAVAVGGAVYASRWMPYGTAGLLEPAPGASVDWVVLAPGVFVVVALVALGAAAAAWTTLVAGLRDKTPRRSTVAAATARAGLPVPVVVGTRFALEPGRGRTAVPIRPALVGAVVGVLGALAAFTFSSGVSDAAGHPERFGQTFQLAAFVGANDQDFGPAPRLLDALGKAKQVAGLDDARTAVATYPGGKDTVTVWAYSPGPRAMPVVVLSGRMPESADEIVLGPNTLTLIGTRVGERISLTGTRGRPVALTVVGSGLVPQGPHNGYSDGAWVTQHGYDGLFTGFKFHLVLVTLHPEARGPDAATALSTTLGAIDPAIKGAEFEPPDPIAEIAELREVRGLPVVLGIFLAVLAVGAVGHALATAVRRRSHDLAVLRALGMTRTQCRWVIFTQASVLALIGLVFGVPLGLALGRTVWRGVASFTPLEYVPPLAATALLLVTPLALLLANVLAAWPGHRAARLRVATVLRAE